MSRICGAIDWQGDRAGLEFDLDLQMAPIKHHSSFVRKDIVSSCAALGLLGFESEGHFGCSTQNFLNRYNAVFCGYVTDLPKWQEYVRRESEGKVEAKNFAEVIPYILETKGYRILRELNGLFAFAIWDNQQRELHLSVDRSGFRPLYFSHRGDRAWFGSEAKSLWPVAPSRVINEEAMEEILIFGFLTEEKSLFSESQRVAPAELITLSSNGNIRRQRYWWFDEWKLNPSLTIEDYLTEQGRLMEQSLKRLFPLSGNKPMVFFSSGCDSRRVLLQMLDLQCKPLLCTTAVQLSKAAYEADTLISQAFAREYGLDTIITDIYPPSMEPKLASMSYTITDYETNQHRWILPLLKQMPVNAGVNFDGLGGDMLVYDTHVTKESRAMVGNIPMQAKYARQLYGAPADAYIRGAGSESALLKRLERHMTAVTTDDNWFTTWAFRQWSRRRTAPFGQMVLKMKFESVCPYLDNDLADFSMSLPWTRKFGRHFQKEILEARYPDIMKRFPTSTYPGITTKPDDFSRPFLRAIPQDYSAKKRAYMHAANARYIMQAPGLFGQLNSTTQASVLFAQLPISLLSKLPSLTTRMWRLDALGHLARALRVQYMPVSQEQSLMEMRDYLFD